MDAINAIWERKDRIKLVLTNVHRTDTNRFGIIQHIEKEFKLPTILMSPDDNTKIVSRGLASGATVCFLKSLSMNDINNLWKDALTREKGEVVTMELVDSDQRAAIPENAVEAGKVNKTSSVDEATRGFQKRKRKEHKETSEQNEENRDDSLMEKKARVVWTREMHQKFLEAIEQIGHERAFPKKIVEVMSVPGLTRENVASHLQKYRMCLKRAQEGFSSSFYGINLRNDVTEPSVFSSPLGNSQQPYWRPPQLGSRSTIFMPSSSHSSFINPEASTSKSRFGLAQSFTPFDAALLTNTKHHMNFGNIRQMDKGGMNQNFRVYGDQTKNILLSIENRMSTSNADHPTSSNTSGSYIGFRLATDGKSVEFGHMRNGEIKREMEFSAVGNSENPVQYPSTLGNCIPLQQYPLPQLQSYSIESSDQYHLTSNNCIVEQQPSLLPLDTNGNDNADQYPSTSITFIPQQEPSIPYLGTDGNIENFDPFPSVLINCIPEQQNSQPPLENESAVQQQQATLSVNCITYEASSPPPVVPFPYEPNSFGVDRGMDDLLQGTGSTSPQLFWDGDFGDTLFDHTD